MARGDSDNRSARDPTTPQVCAPAALTGTSDLTPDDRLYTRQFFQIFAAVVLFMAAVSLQFHFAQYVKYIGYGVDTLGWILATAMAGKLCMRLNVGWWIDRFGCRPVWLIGTVVVAVALGVMQFTSHLWAVTALQITWQMAMAAVMTTIPVFASQFAPPPRRAEAIGTMGMAGFMGMIIGPALGDWVFTGADATSTLDPSSMTPYRVFFTASAALSVLSGLVVFAASPQSGSSGTGPAGGVGSLGDADDDSGPVQGQSPARPRESQLRVVLRYWPGTVLLVGAVFSAVFAFHSSFLERLADARGFQDIKLFYLVYATTAILLRVVCRRVPQQVGRSRALAGGMLLMGAGLICLIGVETEIGLVPAAFVMGAGHCFVFPCMVDLAAERLPPMYRGTGTAVILAAGDVGMLVGYMAMGEVIGAFGYNRALAGLALAVLLSTVVFVIARRRVIFVRRNRLPVGGKCEPSRAAP